MSSRLAWMAAFTLEVSSVTSFLYFWFSFSSSVTFAFTMAIDSFIFGTWSFRSRMFCSRISSGSSAAEIIQPNIERKTRFMRCHISKASRKSAPPKHSLRSLARTAIRARMVFGCAGPDELYPDWERDFGRAAPVELEIGPGRGAFALDHAARHPEIDLVVIGARRSDCELIRARALKRGLRNLIVLHGDARLLVPRLFPPRSLAGLHVQFPDPWWKRRHHKRRLVDVDFALQVRRLLAPGATVDFRTDVAAYAREGEQTWVQAGFERLPDEPPEVLSTRERRYAVTGQPVFRARFRNPLVDLRPIQSERTGREWRDVRRK